MPDLSSWLTYLEAGGHRVRGYLAVFTGSVVCTYTVDTTPTYPAKNLTVTVVSGSASDVLHNYRMTVESSGGEFKGELRVASAGTISTTNLPINEVSKGRIDIRSTDVIKVYSIVYLNDKLVGNDIDFLPDGRITYTDELSNPAPLVCSGGVWAGFVTSGSSDALVYRYGSESAVLDPDSGGGVTHLWSLPSGVSFHTGSTSASVNPTLDAPVGEWLIKHTVTDDDNTKAWSQYTPIRVYDKDSNRPHDVMVESVEGDEEFGWRMSFRLLSSAALTDIPDGALVAFFVDETIGGANISLGAPDIYTSAVKFVGYVKSDSQQLTARQNVISFEAVSPSAKLNLLPGFTKVFISDDTPDKWREVKSLTSVRAIAALLRWYTTWTDCLDLVLPADIRTYPAFYLQKNTPYGQVKELADGLDCRFVCDRRGRGEVHLHPAYVKLADRSAITTTLTLTKKHVISAEAVRQHWRTIDTFEARGFTDGTLAEPIFSRYPGSAPGEGAQSVVVERLIAYDQEDLNERCGRRAALVDNSFINADGVYRRAFELKLTLFGSFDVFDFYSEYIKLDTTDFASASNMRGIDLSDFRYWLKTVFVSYDRGTARVELSLQAETNAPKGVTYYPDTGITLPPIDDPGVPPVGDPDMPTGIPGNVDKMALFTANGLARTMTWRAASPVYDYASWASLSVSGAFQCWVPNGFATGSGWVVTSTGVYYGSISTRVFTLKKAFAAAFDIVGADASFGTENHFVCVGYRETGTTGCSAYYTTDNSTYSAEINVTSFYNNLGYFGKPSVYVSPKTAGLVYVGAFTATGGEDSTAALYRSTDYGATWGVSAALTAPSDNSILYPSFKIPFAHTDELTAFYGTSQGFSSHLTYRSTGTGQADITPTIGGFGYTPFDTIRNGIDISVVNKNRLVMVGYRSGTATYAAFLTNDAFAATPTWTVIAADGTNARYCALAGDTANIGWLWGASDYIKQMSISGTDVTLTDKAGDLADYSVGQIVAIGGW